MTHDLKFDFRAPVVAQNMAAAARTFLDALAPDQRAAAVFPFAGEERFVWNYTPVARNGLRLKEMTEAQRSVALSLFDCGLSVRGAGEARRIIALEPILRETELLEQRPSRWIRDPELYSFSIFGEPGGRAPWAWRAGGHHIGLHFTVVNADLISPTPLFFGANPAEVRHGPSTGQRTLAAEEDLARALLRSLDASQQVLAVVDPVAPADILTRNYRVADPQAPPRGLPYAAMTGEQRERLVALVRHYVGRSADAIAADEWAKIERAGLEDISFAWAGRTERGHAHYYAIKGPTLIIEYDNTQNGANHIHSVWRDFTNDWGADLLANHYAQWH